MPDTVQDLIRAAAAKHGIPAELALAVAEQESGFNPTVTGPEITVGPAKGQRAIGTFQIIPSTAEMLQIDANDPRANIDGGVRYLRQLMDQHQGNLDAVLRSYGGVVDDTTYVPSVMTRIGKFKAQAGQPNVGAGAGRGAGAGALGAGQPGAPVGGATPAGAITTDLPTPPGYLRQLAEPFNPMSPEGRLNLTSAAVSTGVGALTGGAGGALSGTITGRLTQILAPILATGVAAGTEVAAENMLGTGPQRNPLMEGAKQAGYEAGGQLFLWPVSRFSRTLQAPGIIRATTQQLKNDSRAVAAQSAADIARTRAEGAALLEDVRANVQEAVAAANAVKNVGTLRGPGAAEALADIELNGAQQLAAVAAQYNDLLKQPPSMVAAGEAAGKVLTGPAKQALDAVGQQVAAAAKQGPPIDIAPVRDLVNDLAAKWRPAELYGNAGEAGLLGAVPQPLAVGARPQNLKPGQRISIDEYKQLLAQQLESKNLATLPGVLGKIQDVAGETIPFEVAHTVKQILDSAVNWDQRAKSVVARITKATRAGLREQMTGFQPYDDATAAYRALIPLHVRGAGRQMIRLAGDPDGAVKIASMLDSGDAAQALVLRNLLVDQAAAAGQLSQGQAAWNQVRAAYTYRHLLDGGIDKLAKRLDDLATLRPEFLRTVYNDDVGANVLSNLGKMADAYQLARQTLNRSRRTAIREAKETGATALTNAQAAAEQAKTVMQAKGEAFTDSSFRKFMHRTTENIEADATLAAGTGLQSIWGIRAGLRLLSSPAAKDVIEWAAYSNYNATRFQKLLQGALPAAAASNLLREAFGVVAPTGQQGDRITPTGMEAR